MFSLFELLRYALIPNAVTFILLGVFIVAVFLLLAARKLRRGWLWIILFVVELIAEGLSVFFLLRAHQADTVPQFAASLGGVIAFAILLFISLMMLLTKKDNIEKNLLTCP